jgi:hypothetical protein
MDTIDIFVDHFVIHSESRKALILNSSVDDFKSNLRELVSSEVRETLLKRVRALDNEIKLTEPHRRVSPQHDRLVDARTALMSLHNDLLWNKGTV